MPTDRPQEPELPHTPPGSATAAHPVEGLAPTGPLTGPADGPAVVPAGPRVEVPGYEVEAELARGGMGVVYKARHVKLNRPTALKMVLGGRHHDPTARVRFLIEAEAVAALSHPHVVPVYEYGEHDGLPFLAMEFVGGGTLAQRLRRDGPPPARAAAEIMVKLAGAVAAAHARGSSTAT